MIILQVVKNQFQTEWDVRWFMVICLVPLLIVGTVRSMKYLVPFSIMANLFLLIGLIITFYYVLQDIPPISKRPLFVSISKFPLFFSTVVSGLEGIGTVNCFIAFKVLFLLYNFSNLYIYIFIKLSIRSKNLFLFYVTKNIFFSSCNKNHDLVYFEEGSNSSDIIGILKLSFGHG